MGIFEAVFRGLTHVICCLRPDDSSPNVYPPPLPNEPAQQQQPLPSRRTSFLQQQPLPPWHDRPLPPLPLPPRPPNTLQPRPTAPLVLYPPRGNEDNPIAPFALHPPYGYEGQPAAPSLPTYPPYRHEGRSTASSALQPSRGYEERPGHRPQQSTEHRSQQRPEQLPEHRPEHPPEQRLEQRPNHARHAHTTSRGRIDLNQVNQANPHYAGLRERASAAHDARAKAMQASREAHQGGNSALGKALLDKARGHKTEMQRLNKEAAEWIFAMNNANLKPGEMDVHGLFVQEAIVYAKRAVEEAKARGDSELRIIVGKGLHSEGGTAKIKPAIQALMQKQQLAAKPDPQNSGVIIVNFVDRDRGTGNVLRPVNQA
ncbi:hypothetical protein PsYK624_062290 [Phanerochaete sordida]|uniref:Smr domain-containing protein n=1 Tax=Phanerochaete sordida TaxID=48140 RepID=A0A9P3G8D3_9APHY|nr:hypothetical protein PsYK624_062290 [Phanerochaete sordida]